MRFERNQLLAAVRLALVAGMGGGAATGAIPALAQEAGLQGGQPTELGSVVVTGSRIKRTDLETSQPVFTMNREEIEAQGRTSIGDVIQNLTTTGSALNTKVNSGGSGQTRISLRNLGSSRTLILVNGRRWVGGTGLNGEVDLNSIPSAAVDRIEVLKDGASVIYGSDAIGGVVNVILRDDFEGLETSAYYGQTSFGDGARQRYDLTGGIVRGRFSGMLGVSHVQEDPVWAGDREISAVPVFGATPGFRGVSNTPDGRFSLSRNGSDSFTNDGPGTPFRPYTSADNYNTAPDRYLTVDQQIDSLFGNARIDLTDRLRFRTTAQYLERETGQMLPVNAVVFGGNASGRYSGDMAISADSLYNPLGQDVVWGGRMITEAGGRLITRNVETLGVDAGLEGDFEIGDRLFGWEAGYFHGENKSHDVGIGQQDYSRIRDAIGPSMIDPASGEPICVRTAGDTSSVIAGCVPLNMLGGAGSITPEMLEYISFVENSYTGYKQKTAYANLTGDIVDLPAGPLAFAAGVERREESGYDHPDMLIATGVTNGFSRQPTEGGYEVDEAYLELAVPLLADRPWAQLLDISLATRYSDYSNFGNTLNSKFGFRWKPTDQLMLRGNYTEGFRAPAIRELYLGQSTGTQQNMSDPCAATLQGQPQPNPVACPGVPADLDQLSPATSVTAGGNPDVGPETAVTQTVGLVYSPSWAPGLDLSLDWWRVEIEEAISGVPAQKVLDLCYRAGNPNACSLVQRDVDGQIVSVRSVPTNIGSYDVEGYDLTVGYRFPQADWGRLSLVWDSTYLTRYEVDQDGDGYISQDPVTGDGGNQVGRGDNWRIRSNLALRWQRGVVGANWNVRYYSHLAENCSGLGTEAAVVCSDPDRYTDLSEPQTPPNPPVANGPDLRPRNRIPSAVYHDISAWMDTPWRARVTLGIQNVLDRDPPYSPTTTNSFGPEYELPGRFYYMRYHQKF